MLFSSKHGWIDVEGQLREAADREADQKQKRADYEDAVAQANAPETIPPTGRHHRADGL